MRLTYGLSSWVVFALRISVSLRRSDGLRLPNRQPSPRVVNALHPLPPRPALAFPRRFAGTLTSTAPIPSAVRYVLASELLVAAFKAFRPIFRFFHQRLVEDEPCSAKGTTEAFDGKEVACAILAMNGAVLVAWHAAFLRRDHRAISWMDKHFIYRPGNPTACQAHPHTVLTAAFSHIDPEHFTANAAAITCFVPGVAAAMGRRRFAYFYVAAAYASEWLDARLFSLLPPLVNIIGEKAYVELIEHVDRFVPVDGKRKLIKERSRLRLRHRRRRHSRAMNRKRQLGGLGASGVITSIISYRFLRMPGFEFANKRLKRLKALHIVLLFIAEDLIHMHTDDNVGHGVHIGGYLFGMSVWFVECLMDGTRRRKMFRQTRMFLESAKHRVQEFINKL